MRHAQLLGLGIVVLATCGFTFVAPPPLPVPFSTCVAQLRAPSLMDQIAHPLPRPQPLTPQLTIDTQQTLRFLATQA